MSRHRSTNPVGPERVRDWMMRSVIVLACLLAYSNSFSGAFVFDDANQILLNDAIHDLSKPGDVLKANPRPVTNVTFAVNYAMSPPRTPGGVPGAWLFHLFNLAIHAGAALVVFGLVRRLCALDSMAGAARGRGAWLALAVALLWAVHPLNTQAVTYIVQRSESLMALFYLLTMYCAVRAATDRENRVGWQIGAVAACAAGMGSKAVMVTAPVAVLLIDRTLIAGTFGAAVRARWVMYLGLAATWGVLALTGIAQGVLRTEPNAGAAVGFAFKGISPLEYFLSQPGVLLHYLRLAVWPSGQVIDYDWGVARGAASIVPGLVVVSVLGLAALWGLWKRTWWGLTGVLVFLVFAPTSSFVPIKDLAFEHRVYLPLVGVVALVVGGGVAMWGVVAERLRVAPDVRRAVPAIAGAVAAVALMSATLTRNRVYGSEVLLWRDVTSKRPANARAWNNLGVVLKRQPTRLPEAEEALRRAIEVDPRFGPAYVNLGAALDQMGRPGEAVESYRSALERDPGMVEVRLNLASALARLGRTDESALEYESVLEQHPDDPAVRMEYGGLLFDAERYDDAAAQFRRVIESDEGNIDAWLRMGNTEFRRGLYLNAALAYQQVVRARPGDADAWFNHGMALHRAGKLIEAEGALRRAIDANPKHASAQVNLGLVLVDQGRYREALVILESAVELAPGLEPRLRDAIERARAGLAGSE